MDIFTFLHMIDHDETTVGLHGLNNPRVRSFKHYFERLFSERFGSLSPQQILRFAILNFVCQQLSVRATYAPQHNFYLFLGGGMDFAASVLGMVPVLRATWLQVDGDPCSEAQVREYVQAGAQDDLQEFVRYEQDFETVVSSYGEASLGAAVFADRDNAPEHLIEEASRRLSHGGVALFPAGTTLFTSCSPNEFECVSIAHGAVVGAFPGGVSLVRRRA